MVTELIMKQGKCIICGELIKLTAEFPHDDLDISAKIIHKHAELFDYICQLHKNKCESIGKRE